MPFRFIALDPAPFAPLFHLPESALALHGARRTTATRKPGFPCRVSLADAEPGEEVLLVHFEHQPAPTPFRASHAIYVRKGSRQATPGMDDVPAFLLTRLLSVRCFSREGMLVAAEVAKGPDLDQLLPRLFGNAATEDIHIHNAAMGCYLTRVTRV